jgi:hypothetical protein
MPTPIESQLGKDADCPLALWVDGSCELERAGVGNVYVCEGRPQECMYVCVCTWKLSAMPMFVELDECW